MFEYFFGLFEVANAASMSYVAAKYFIFVAITVIIYYILPLRCRWWVLLGASGYFYYEVSTEKKQLVVFLASIVISYLCGLFVDGYTRQKKNLKAKMVLGIGVIASAVPLFVTKMDDLLNGTVIYKSAISWIVPVGLAFYSMQIIAYLVDIYRGEIIPQKNVFKFVLFVSFFPIIIQGPISRYAQLGGQLFEGHKYNDEKIMRGIQLILWGLFLKYMIADKASVVVNMVFDNYRDYSGIYVWVAGILYSIQLYADFLSCVSMSQGVAGLFGIELIDNFNHPYFSTSIKEFWRRWHISFSQWLRDYVYISLGGNKKGKLKKYINLVITFGVSGLWHGGSWKYLFWGLMHAGYQIVGDQIHGVKDRVLEQLSLRKDSKTRKILEMIVTSFLVMIAWIIFRAQSLKAGIKMIISMFSAFNPWILFDNSIFTLGLSQKEFEVLAVAVLILVIVSFLQEKGIKIRDWFNRRNIFVRWIVYLCVIWSIWIFGTYGYGFNAADFIYGGF